MSGEPSRRARLVGGHSLPGQRLHISNKNPGSQPLVGKSTSEEKNEFKTEKVKIPGLSLLGGPASHLPKRRRNGERKTKRKQGAFESELQEAERCRYGIVSGGESQSSSRSDSQGA